MIREWLARLRDWFHRDALARELADELRFHRERLERDAVVGGMSEADATYAARRRLGSTTRATESARERWSIPSLDHLLQDIRYALRGLRRSPGFTATVVITLGLGIGANAAMFGVVDRLMFRPLPYLRDPASVNRVYLQVTSRGQIVTNAVFPYTRYRDLERWTRSFSAYAAFSERTYAVGTGVSAREQQVAGVSGTFFDFFNARPVLGRFFDASEDSIPRGASVAVLDHAFWEAEFGGKDVIGQSLQVGTLVYTIIGVAPKGFSGVTADRPPVVYVPITTIGANEGRWAINDYYKSYRWDFTSMMVRRKPNVGETVASADLSQAFVLSRDAARLQMPTVAPATVAHPTGIAGAIKPAAGPDAGLEATTLLWVAGVALIVLLIACANVANLMFARILRRRREIAMRLALGVSRRRLVGQLLTESLILSIFGCIAGILVAQWGGAALRVFVLPGGSDAGVVTDGRTLGVACGCAIAAAMLTAVGPALLAIRGDLAETLRAGARDGAYQRSRMRSALLILQGALSVILLVGAGLFVRSLENVRGMRLGYDAEPVLMALPNLRGFEMDSAATFRFQRGLLETARRIPGVASATLVNSRPFATNMELLYVDGIDSVQKFGRFVIQLTTPDYFTVMNTHVVRGRAFTAQDRAGTPRVTVVSEAMARVLWPGKDAIGQCIRIGADTMPCTTVIGIAENASYNNLTDDKRFAQYVPLDQRGPNGGNKMLLRMSGTYAQSSVETVRRELQRAMPGQGYVTVQPFEDLVDAQRHSWALGATMFVAFGVLALIVAAVGLYGVIAYNVAQRMHELGIRIALGAQSRDVVKLVVGQGISFAASGVAIGLGVSLFAAPWLQPLLFQTSAKDPTTYGTVGAMIVLVALAASAIPAVRATRADPNTALRSE